MIKMKIRHREIPYNYTSADDNQVIRHLFGQETLNALDKLKARRVTGRSARLLYKFMGDLFIMERNAFIFQNMLDHPTRRQYFFTSRHRDLTAILEGSNDPDLNAVIEQCRNTLNTMGKRLKSAHFDRKRILKHLGPIVGKKSIYVDPFNLMAHATDATDWRLFPPVAVVSPSHPDQVPDLITTISGLGYHIIPRGGGTGLTGGSVPLTRTCIIINTEKLNRIHGVHYAKTDMGDADGRFPFLRLEAGVITDHAMKEAKRHGLVFATDPTSSWASTIGGNIAENAGGKKAVLWGTALDNILSYRMVMPDGTPISVHRKNHALRRIDPNETVTFEIKDNSGKVIRTVRLAGDEIRKPGLGKDVTNKALNGLPGIQKEGCDGIITSADFILHKDFPIKQTVCLEFFGRNMAEAGRVIADISALFKTPTDTTRLMALEHFDEEYIKAIDYKAKSDGVGRLKAVLLVDIVARIQDDLDRGRNKIENILKRYEHTQLTIARDEQEANRFWRDRKRLGAIAKRTNAFKLNEDIVLPIHALADFADFVDTTNLSEKRHNQLSIVKDISAYLEVAEPLEDPDWLIAKVSRAREMAEKTRTLILSASGDQLESGVHIADFLSYLSGLLRGYSLVSETVKKIAQENASRLIVIATHMHAGDGNVHVNIPVLSNDREMMVRAAATADAVMEEAVSLGGVVSGEHGIGITKIKHLPEKNIQALETYRNSVDPDRIMNPEKLCNALIGDSVFTPSFNLLELEASILHHGSLGTLSGSIANCVRCGRCKDSCPVFYPHQNLFFHPRNKNLAVGALIEALLYEAQRTHSTEFKALHYLEQIADHCTICHKCHDNCPVNIDSGKVSILEREILNEKRVKHKALPTRISLSYLKSRNDLVNRGMRALMVSMGTRCQQWAVKTVQHLPDAMNIKQRRPLQRFLSPMATPPAGTLRRITPKAGLNQAILVEPVGKAAGTVFYFPGCGSERLFSQIGKASLFLLLHHGIRVVLPPPFLCCGFPFKSSAETEEAKMLSLRNTIIFSQIRGMFSDLDFDAVIISCGTCLESLSELKTDHIFDCRLADISQFIIDTECRGDHACRVQLDTDCSYHAPCHDSLKGQGEEILKTITSGTVVSVPFCCSEAGTLSLSRPDISNAMLIRKQQAIKACISADDAESIILTNCPSCIQGLSRNAGEGIKPVHMAEHLALTIGGPDWETALNGYMANCEVISF